MYVFGFDIPIAELLAICLLLILFGVIFVLLEIIKLRKLITMEKEAVTRLPTAMKELESYIKANVQKGTDTKKIQNDLVRSGWPKNVVKETLGKIKP
ncbi:hypothetical protein J4464_03320 [Candidatus Woesearchaeota archaeon]|nr:hypothetical protein [Candidatus Woesearchaeota archaeon]